MYVCGSPSGIVNRDSVPGRNDLGLLRVPDAHQSLEVVVPKLLSDSGWVSCEL